MCDIKKHNECNCSTRCHQDLGSFTSRAKALNDKRRKAEAAGRRETNGIVVTTLIGLSLMLVAWVFVGAPAQHRIDLAQQENVR